ncbi:MAG TPA: OsmC family protein [Prolixibacteraceae bacterium]|nr:OsmC family protein [Prolixibacteraceae bacterium]
MATLNFSTKGVSENPTKFNAQSRTFNIVVDEPEQLGGTNHGANPVEYILAGYAGCLNVVGHLVAKEQHLKLNKLSIEIDGDLNPDRFLGVSDNDRAGFKIIRVKITPDTNASKEQLEKWINEVEKRCPVNDNLQNPTPIQVELIT